MSLIIKGMEMPQAGDIIIYGQIDGKLQCTIVTRGKPTKWCEASEVSAPHGRLIDADKLNKKLERHRDMCGDIEMQYGIDMVIRILNNTPTIIEAEE